MLSDLSRRFDISPAVANFELGLSEGDGNDLHYFLTYVDGNARTAKEQAAINKITEILGFRDCSVLRFPDLMAVEEAVDKALSLAPRGRVR